MARTLLLQSGAKNDILQAFRWYHARSPRIARAFVEALSRLFSRIAESPLLFRVVTDTYRRAPLQRFPYAAWFSVHDALDTVNVIALKHARQRNPRNGG